MALPMAPPAAGLLSGVPVPLATCSFSWRRLRTHLAAAVRRYPAETQCAWNTSAWRASAQAILLRCDYFAAGGKVHATAAERRPAPAASPSATA